MPDITYPDFGFGLIDVLNDVLSETDFKLSAKIIHSDGKEGLELKPIVTEMNYYEDLFGNACSGQLILSDSSNYQHELTLCGDEFLKLQLYKPGNDADKGLHRYFRIYNMSGRNLSKDANENYVLNFSTEEIFLSEQYRVSKAYKDVTIAQIVVDIAKNYLKIKDEDLGITQRNDGTSFYKNIFDTMGKYHIIVPNLKPMEAINWLCTLAISVDTRLKGASFVFFQDKDGWNFKPILGIYGDFPTYGKIYNTELDPYEYRVKNNQSEDVEATGSNDQTRNILSYEILNNYDSFEATQAGLFSNKLVWSDNHKRLHETEIFDYEKYFNELKSSLYLYKDKQRFGLMSNAVDRFDKKHNEVPDTVMKMGFKTVNNKIDKTIPYRHAQILLASATRLKIAILGDTSITIGVTVYLDIKAPAPVQISNAEPKKKLDKLYSGWYLVTALRHRLDQEFGFETVLELSKDSFLTAVSEMDNPGLKPFDNSSEHLRKARTLGTF